MCKLLEPGGELIVGNFSDNNPIRTMMEIYAQWYLIHRSKKELFGLAVRAGVPEEKIDVRSEKLGINLFLQAKK